MRFFQAAELPAWSSGTKGSRLLGIPADVFPSHRQADRTKGRSPCAAVRLSMCALRSILSQHAATKKVIEDMPETERGARRETTLPSLRLPQTGSKSQGTDNTAGACLSCIWSSFCPAIVRALLDGGRQWKLPSGCGRGLSDGTCVNPSPFQAFRTRRRFFWDASAPLNSRQSALPLDWVLR